MEVHFDCDLHRNGLPNFDLSKNAFRSYSGLKLSNIFHNLSAVAR
jgi:hypothetical protein